MPPFVIVNTILEVLRNIYMQAKSLCDRVGLYGWAAAACYNLAEIFYDTKDFSKSKEFYCIANSFFERVQLFPSWVRWGQLGIARCRAVLGEQDMDLQTLRAVSDKNRLKLVDGWALAYLGEIFLNLGKSHFTEAEYWIIKAIEANERNGAKFRLGLNHALYAEFFKIQGDRTNAQGNLGKAIEILRKCGADGWVEKYERELATIQ